MKVRLGTFFHPTLRRYRDLLAQSMTAKVIMLSMVILLITMLFPRGLTKYYEYQEGSIWNEEDLVASFGFPIYRDIAKIEEEQNAARWNTPLSFDRIEKSAARATKDTLRSIVSMMMARFDRRLQVVSARESEAMLASLPDMILAEENPPGLLRSLPKQAIGWLLQMRYRELRSARQKDSLYEFRKSCNGIIDLVYERGLLNKEKKSIHQNRLAISAGNVEDLVPVSSILDKNDLQAFIRDKAESMGYRDQILELFASLIPPLCQPNLLYNDSRTQVAVRAAIERVPRSENVVKENEKIVNRHERITAGIKAKLDSYKRAAMEREGDMDSVLEFLGRAGHTIVILSFLMIYLFLFRRQIFFNNSRLLLLLLIIVLESLLAYLSFSIPLKGPVQYLILVPAAAMLITIIFDSRVAFYGTVTIAFLVGALRGNDYSIILASILTGTLALYTVRDVKNRTQIFRSLLYILVGYVFVITVDGLQRSLSLNALLIQYIYALINAILSPIVTFGLLVFFERVFSITTDLTLLELSDFNHPLLRELSRQAPGTFHHSLVMGSLAEAAATAIGANAILARVGAYYHDVGKISDPEYFVENQAGSVNIHESLEPQQSATKIINHVTEGIRLGRQYRLPQRVIDFIPAHHGTTLVTYFYEKQRIRDGGDVPPESFRYGGPTPTTKETAIVMLADTIEAAARALEEPTVDSIDGLITSVVNKRMQQGQLDHCDLTFRDLTAVKKSFLSILTGIHHSRIKYPSETEAELAKKAAERTKKMLNLPSTTEAIMQRMRKMDQS